MISGTGYFIRSTLLTLVVVPVLYTYLDAWGRRVSRKLVKAAEEPLHSPAVGTDD